MKNIDDEIIIETDEIIGSELKINNTWFSLLFISLSAYRKIITFIKE